MQVVHIFLLLAFLQFSIVDACSRKRYISREINYEIDCGITKGDFFDKIVGGKAAAPGEFPWLVSFQVYLYGKYMHVCGATIINSKWLLTAAHCTKEFKSEDIVFVAGEYSLKIDEGHEQKRYVKQILYKSYDSIHLRNDIALVELTEPIELDSNYVAPICVPRGHEIFENTSIAAGWGRLAENGMLPDVPNKVSLPLLNKEECAPYFVKTKMKKFITNCQVCTLSNETQDSCQGDSGGPLMCLNKINKRVYLCGITSWGYGCARAENPGVYTKVSCFSDWIETNLK